MRKPRKDKHRKDAGTPGIAGERDETTIASRHGTPGIKEPCIMLGLLAALAVIVFHDSLFFQKAFLYKDIGNDSLNFTYPHTVHLIDYLRTVGLPRWSFNVGMGQNIFPLGTGDIFLPLFYFFGRNNIGFAMGYVEVLKILIGGFFFYLYLKTVGLTPSASIVGGVLFGFSGYMILGGGWYMFSYDAMCGAIVLYGFESLFKRHTWWILPIPFALMGAYQPFDLYLYGLLLFVYSTVRFIEDRDWNFAAYARLMSKTIALALLGAALSGPFLFENVAQLMQGPRIAGGASYSSQLASQPLMAPGSPIELSSVALRLFSNDLQGTGSDFRGWSNYLESPILYCGLIALLAAPQFLVSLSGRKRWMYAGLAIACVTALIFPYLRLAFWGFTGNYYRTFSYFISLLILFFGVRGLNAIERTSSFKPRVLLVSLGVLLALLYLPPYEKYTAVDHGMRGLITFLLLVYAVLIAFRAKAEYMRLIGVLTVVIVSLEVAYFSNITVNHRTVVTAEELSQRVGYNDYTVDAVRHLDSIDPGFFRINKNYNSGLATLASINDAQIQQYFGSSSYHGFNQMYYVRFLQGVGATGQAERDTRWAHGLNNQVLQVFGSVKYEFVKGATGDYASWLWDPLATFGDVQVLKNKFFLPLGFGYGSFVLKSDFSRLDVMAKDRVLLKAFVIDDSEQDKYKGFTRFYPASLSSEMTVAEFGKDIARLQASSMQMTEHQQSLIRGTVHLEASSLVFFSIPFDKGWSATVDGKPAELQVVDFGLMGLLVDRGQHSVELQFRPRFLAAGAMTSTASLLVYVLLLFAPRWTRRVKEQS